MTNTIKAAKKQREYMDEACYLYFKYWNKYGKCRTYINDYKGRTLGYIENGEVIINDQQGNSREEINTAIANYQVAQSQIC